MLRKFSGFAFLVAIGALLFSLANCGRDQELVGIQIQPSTETFGDGTEPVSSDNGLTVQLQALGTYIHPPVTKDITNQVVWASNDTQMMTVNSTGLVTATGGVCGSTLVSASVTTNKSSGGITSDGAIVIGYMTGNVTCFTGTGSGGGPVLTLAFGSNATGTVSVSPSGFSCTSPNPCTDPFAAGTALTVTATPTGSSTTATWQGCPVTTNTNVCTFTIEQDTTLTVTFS
jgi:hypothetical protein